MVYSRLIRFRAEDSKTYFGEPEIDNADDLLIRLHEKQLFATVLVGTDPFDISAKLKPEGRKRVEELLPILSPSDVPIVRCIGLNYIKHSESKNSFYNHARSL